MTDMIEIHITVCENKISLEAGSNDDKFEMGDVLDILCNAIAGIYLESVEEGTGKEEFANVIRDLILRRLTVKEQEDTHCDTK